MRYNVKNIWLDNICLTDSRYYFEVLGLFDFEKTYRQSDLYSDGTILNGCKIESKKITLNGVAKSRKFKDYIELNTLLSKKNLLELKVEIRDLGIVTSNVAIENKVTDNNVTGKISCSLIAQDPYLYSEEKTLSINEYRSGITFPLTMPFMFGENQEVSKSIENEGTKVSYPIIEIKGPCINPIVQNLTTKERLSFNGLELDPNDVLIIDNRPRTRGILLNGVNRIDLKDGSWISCTQGTNEFAFNRVSSSKESLCTVKLRSRWI